MSLAENTPLGRTKLPKPNVKDSRVLVYLNMCGGDNQYVNTEEENISEPSAGDDEAFDEASVDEESEKSAVPDFLRDDETETA